MSARALVFLVALLAAVPCAAALVVTTDADVVADDGQLSLREAIEIANRAGSQTITFAPELAGATIRIRGALYLTNERIAIEGNGDVTIDGSEFDERYRLPFLHEPDILTILSSQVAITGLRFRNVKHRAIVVQAGGIHGAPPVPTSQHVRDILIADNDFDTTGFVSGDTYVDAIRIWTDLLGGAVSASIEDVRVVRNRIAGFNANGIIITIGGDACSLRNAVIEDNEIEGVPFPIEVNAGNGAGILVSGVTISNNRITGQVVVDEPPGIFVGIVPATGPRPNGGPPWPPSVGNVVENTVIVRNRSSQTIQLDGAVAPNARDNVVRNTLLSGNAVRARGAVFIGSGVEGSTDNRVEGVRIVNDSYVSTSYSALNVVESGSNRVEDLTVRNSIIVAGASAGINGVPVSSVSSTITNTPGFGGTRGNLQTDPRFVDEDAFDLHLRPGSPAIDAATSGAPESDGDCRERVSVADIGAFEYGAPARAKLTLERRGWGNGTITAQPAGLECGTAQTFPLATTVTLDATAAPGSRFDGWSCATPLVLDTERVCAGWFQAALKRRAMRF